VDRNGHSLLKPAKAMGQSSGRSKNRLIVICLIGIITGCIACGISKGTMQLVMLRARVIQAIYSWNPVLGVVSFFSWNLILAVLSSVAVVYYAPGAKGSGIPEIKAYLNGVLVPHFLNMRSLVVTSLTTITAVSSGLVIGPEGPLVHIGAIVASGLTYGRNIYFRWLPIDPSNFLKEFNNDLNRRDFIAIGAGTGFAAAFGAPVGGVLFALEEAASYFPLKLLWRALLASTLACFSLLLVSEGVLYIQISHYGVLYFGEFGHKHLYPWELLGFVLIGVITGLLGALWNHNAHVFFHYRPKVKHLCVAEVACLSLLTSFVTVLLVVYGGHCQPMWDPNLGGPKTSRYTWAQQLSWNDDCEEDYFNDMAYLWLSDPATAITAVISSSDAFSWQTMLYTGTCFYSLLSLTFGTSITAGIFMPTIMSGSCIGGCIGYLARFLIGERFGTGPWALMGAAGLLGGIQRTTISLCVIILEGTGQVRFLLPVILTVGTAKFVGDLFNDGVYHVMIHNKGFPHLDDGVRGGYDTVAKDVMTSPVDCLYMTSSLGEILHMLETTEHHGFGILEFRAKKDTDAFRGVVLRSHLEELVALTLLEMEKEPSAAQGPKPKQRTRVKKMQQEHVQRQRRDSDMQNLTDLLSTTREMSESTAIYKNVEYTVEQQQKLVCLDDICNMQPATVHLDTPFPRVYEMFLTLGLRHLPVLDDNGVFSGIITRANLYEKVEGIPVAKWTAKHGDLPAHVATEGQPLLGVIHEEGRSQYGSVHV